MGTHPRAHRARAMVVPGRARRDAYLHLEHEAAAGTRVPRGRRARARARRSRAALNAQGRTQAQPAPVRGAQARAVQTRGVL